MPANNRMQTSSSLNTHSIWQNAIGYDPYAAEQTSVDTGVKAEAAANAHDNMKALLALAKTNRLAAEEEKGAWKGTSKLRGGWAGGKDLGDVALDPSASGGNALGDDMPSSTSSFDSDDDDLNGAASAGVAMSSLGKVAADGRKRDRERGRDESDGGGRGKKRKTSDKREKSGKHGKKEKHKHRKDKEAKKHKSKKKHRHHHYD